MSPRARVSALEEVARLHGVMTTYVDATGKLQRVRASSVRGVLKLLGVSLGSRGSLERAEEAALARAWARPVEPVLVARSGEPLRLRVRWPEGPRASIDWHLRDESGAERTGTARSSRPAARRRVAGVRYAEHHLTLSTAPPPGYYDITLRRGERSGTSRLIVAPPRRRVEPPAARRHWGVFLPLHALRSARTWGVGDFTALRELARWAGLRGATFVGTLPLVSVDLDGTEGASPYRPLSRRFWNEAFLDPTRAPEFRRSLAARAVVARAAFRSAVRRLNARPFTDWTGVAQLKRRVLEPMLDELERRDSARRRRFRAYVRHDPTLWAYALFRARRETPKGARADRIDRAARWHAYVQWLADGQLRAAARAGARRGASLYLDLPVGVHPEGFDVQSDRNVFVEGATIGAPPDPGYPNGQDWALPPWHPERLRETGYRAFIATLRRHLAFARTLRIDHVMGLHRLFWIPVGHPPRDGVYVRYASEEFYAILELEAYRAGSAIVGEDLGTVPPEVRPALARHAMLRSFVAELEWDSPPARPPSAPAASLASVNTHDMLPFAAYWAERQRAGRPPFAGVPAHATASAALRAVHARLARGRSRYLLVNLEDLWGEERPQNVPGTTGPQNFSRRARPTLERVRRLSDVQRALAEIDRARRERSAA